MLDVWVGGWVSLSHFFSVGRWSHGKLCLGQRCCGVRSTLLVYSMGKDRLTQNCRDTRKLDRGLCLSRTIFFYFSLLLWGGWVVPSENQATLWLHLASWNLPNSQLSWESKMELSVAILGPKIFVKKFGAQNNFESKDFWSKNVMSKNVGPRKYALVLTKNNATSWLHLARWNLPDSQLSWESKMEPSVAILILLNTL